MKTKGKPRGVPFQKGADDRRHLAGSKNRAALDFKAEFKRVMGEELNVRKLVRTLIRKAEQGEPWAISEVLNRGLGKPAQVTDDKFDGAGQVNIRVLYGSDRIDEETGVLIRDHGYIGPQNPIIDARKPLGEERARVRAILADKTPAAVGQALLPPHRDAGPSPRALEAFAEGDKRRLLEAGQAEEAARDEGQDYIKACEEA